MSTAAIILACIAFMLVVGMIRGNPGRSVADTAFLVMLVGIITIADFAFGQFMDTGDAGKLIAIAFAAAFAVDALYGLMAPERQKRRDRKLRRLMKRRA